MGINGGMCSVPTVFLTAYKIHEVTVATVEEQTHRSKEVQFIQAIGRRLIQPDNPRGHCA